MQKGTDLGRLAVIIVIAVVILGGLAFYNHLKSADKPQGHASSSHRDAKSGDRKSADKPAAGSSDQASQATSFTAADGDSYTGLARQAVAAYAHSAKLSLSHAQRVAAETYLAQQASAPDLDVGQAVSFSHTDLAAAVHRAQNLSAADLAAWQPYADLVSWTD